MITLYKTDKKSVLRIWRIYVDTDTIITEHGIDGGTITKSCVKYAEGKNIGKKNETSPSEQAHKEMLSKIKKKRSEGYSERKSGKLDALPQVMLAHDFLKHKKKIKYPWVSQPKLDGIRAKYVKEALFSRTDKAFKNLNKSSPLLAELKILAKLIKPLNPFFDGELYSTDLNFDDIMSAVMNVATPLSELNKVQYVIFDIMDNSATYEEIYKCLSKSFNLHKFKYLKLISSVLVNNENDVRALHSKYVEDGYEGSILRNPLSKYDFGHRSYNLLKLKDFKDSEFKVVGYTNGKGQYSDMVIWICETKDGLTFNVNPIGTHEQKRNMLLNADKFVGKFITVKYQELTKNGIPRFPTTLRGGELDFREF